MFIILCNCNLDVYSNKSEYPYFSGWLAKSELNTFFPLKTSKNGARSMSEIFLPPHENFSLLKVWSHNFSHNLPPSCLVLDYLPPSRLVQGSLPLSRLVQGFILWIFSEIAAVPLRLWLLCVVEVRNLATPPPVPTQGQKRITCLASPVYA